MYVYHTSHVVYIPLVNPIHWNEWGGTRRRERKRALVTIASFWLVFPAMSGWSHGLWQTSWSPLPTVQGCHQTWSRHLRAAVRSPWRRSDWHPQGSAKWSDTVCNCYIACTYIHAYIYYIHLFIRYNITLNTYIFCTYVKTNFVFIVLHQQLNSPWVHLGLPSTMFSLSASQVPPRCLPYLLGPRDSGATQRHFSFWLKT